MQNTPTPDNASYDRDYLETLLNEKQAAAFLGVAPRTLQKWRVIGGGPVFISISNRAARYRRKDLFAWVEVRRKSSTSDTRPDLGA